MNEYGPMSVPSGTHTGVVIQTTGSCHIAEVRVDGVTQRVFGEGVRSYTQFFWNVSSDHHMEAFFSCKPIGAGILGAVIIDDNTNGSLDEQDSLLLDGVKVVLENQQFSGLMTNVTSVQAVVFTNSVAVENEPNKVNGIGTSSKIVNGRPAIAYIGSEVAYPWGKGRLKYVRANDSLGSSWGSPQILVPSGVEQRIELGVIGGRPAITFVHNNVLKYIRSLDIDGTVWASPTQISTNIYYYARKALLEVSGRPAIAYVAHDGLKYVRASDTNGVSWPSPLDIVPWPYAHYFDPDLQIIGGRPAIVYGNGPLYYRRANDAVGGSWAAAILVTTNSYGRQQLRVVNGKPAVVSGGATRGVFYSEADDSLGTGWRADVLLDNPGYIGLIDFEVIGEVPMISYYETWSKSEFLLRCSDAGGSNWLSPVVVGQFWANVDMVGNNGEPSWSFWDTSSSGLYGPIHYTYQYRAYHGGFNFLGVPSGSYRVHVLDPQGYRATGDSDGEAPDQIDVTVNSGVYSSNHYFLVSPDQPASYSIVVTADVNGTVSPIGPLTVNSGGRTALIVAASAGCYISDVLLNGIRQDLNPDQLAIHTQQIPEVHRDIQVEARFNCPPDLQIAAEPLSGLAPLRVHFDLSGSTDADNDIVLSAYDQLGDGSFEITSPNNFKTRLEYSESGSFTTLIQVVDAEGAFSRGAVTVTVHSLTPPVAQIVASPQSGTAPLAVVFSGTNSVPSVNHTVLLYEWDFDGDGTYDFVSSNGLAVNSYSEPGDFPAVLKITDSLGLISTTNFSIEVLPAANPPSVTLVIQPEEGRAPLWVALVAEARDFGLIREYQWDVEGDGVVDFSTGLNSITQFYETAGTYRPMVRVYDDDGLSGVAETSLFVALPSKLKAWIVKPSEGAQIHGNSVTLKANTAPGELTQSVQFQYAPLSSTNWSEIGQPISPPASSFNTVWDVTSLLDGSYYALRVLATGMDGSVVVSPEVVVEVETDGNYTSESCYSVSADTGSGKLVSRRGLNCMQNISENLFDGTAYDLPMGSAELGETISLEITGENTNPINGAVEGRAALNRNRRIGMDGNTHLTKMMEIRIPFPDENQDGLLDGTLIRETSLDVAWFDRDRLVWKYLPGSVIHLEANYVSFRGNASAEYGVFGNANLLSPCNGGTLIAKSAEKLPLQGANNLVDGNWASYWSSPSNTTGETFLFSFLSNSLAIVRAMGIKSFSGNGAEVGTIVLEGSTNGVDFFEVATEITSGSDLYEEFGIGSATMRYARIILEPKFSGAGPLDVSEVVLYGDNLQDHDLDGLNDFWEIKFFGSMGRNGDGDFDSDQLKDADESWHDTNPTLADTDGDGDPDGHEVLAGTNPQDGADLFEISNAEPGQSFGHLVFRWNSVTGRTYKVLSSSSFDGTWSNICEYLSLGNPLVYTNRPNPDSDMYFRLEILQ